MVKDSGKVAEANRAAKGGAAETGRASNRSAADAKREGRGDAAGLGKQGASDGAEQVGLGLDVVEIERVERILGRSPSFKRAFSDDERAYCEGKTRPAAHFATRFAAKVAVLKALGLTVDAGINPRSIEVRRTSKGRPFAVLFGKVKDVADVLGVTELPISLSFTHTEAVACAMAITQSSKDAAAKRRDPLAELAEQFKETRSILDELG